MGIWACGRVGVWVSGCVGLWVCGCVIGLTYGHAREHDIHTQGVATSKCANVVHQTTHYVDLILLKCSMVIDEETCSLDTLVT